MNGSFSKPIGWKHIERLHSIRFNVVTLQHGRRKRENEKKGIIESKSKSKMIISVIYRQMKWSHSNGKGNIYSVKDTLNKKMKNFDILW